MEDYLMHHGRLGQKWGIMNGPPYPLSGSQLSPTQKKNGGVSESAKEKYGDDQNQKKTVRVVEGQSGSLYRLRKAQDVYYDRETLTNQEIQEYLNRVNLERQLSTLAKSEYESEHKFQTWAKKQSQKLIDKAVDTAANRFSEIAKDYISDLLPKKENDYSTKSAQEVYKNMDKMSTKELEDWFKRHDYANKLSSMNAGGKS